MKRTVLAALALVHLAACGAPALDGPGVGELPTVDAATMQDAGNGADTRSPPLDSGASVEGGDAGEAGAIAPDAGPDSRGPDAAPPPPPDADAAPPTMPDAGPAIDARADAGPTPVCTSSSPSCDAAVKADERVRATFTEACAPEGFRQCGGVPNGVVETLPLICRMGAWRLAGMASGSQWVPAYECSKGCAAGKLCDP
jgi:hypothetical protein